MKIGIFDSGVGGLIVARAIRKLMPEYDYVYLGDTKRVPYGNRSHETVYEFTREAVDYLFKKENCAIVIIACNTASARALARIQKEYLPENFSKKEMNRKVLGVLIPSAEECAKYERVGVLATRGTVSSDSFPNEIKKNSEHTKVFQNSAPILVPLAEEGELKLATEFLKKYLMLLLLKKIDALALGCTHYPIFKKEIKKIVGKNVKIISQDEIIPKKLREYFARHPEIEKNLSKKGTAKILVTDITKNVSELSNKWFGKDVKPKLVNI
ncbi:MAG: glutamate racemase [Patescibacteria group bacterium]